MSFGQRFLAAVILVVGLSVPMLALAKAQAAASTGLSIISLQITDSPTQIIAGSTNTPIILPSDTPVVSPVDTPAASPVDTPVASPVDTPVVSPVDTSVLPLATSIATTTLLPETPASTVPFSGTSPLPTEPVTISGDVLLTTAGPSGGNRLVVLLLERTSGGAVIVRAATETAIDENALPPYLFTLPAVDRSVFNRQGSRYYIQATIALGIDIRFQGSKAYTPGSTEALVISLSPFSGYLPTTGGPTVVPTVAVPTTDSPTQISVAPTDTPAQSVDTSIAATVLPPATPATPVSTPDLGAMANAELDKLAEGKILYNPPEAMTIGEDVIIEARVTQNIAVSLTPGLQGPGAPIEEPLRVGPFMKATLSGDKDKFKIIALTSEEQLVGGSTFTQWKWDVVPLEAGEQALYLIVTVRIKIPGQGEEKRDILVKDTRIKVQVNPAYSVQKFVEANWQWLLTAIVIPLGIFGWNRWRKKGEPPSVIAPQPHRSDTMLSTVEAAKQLNISTAQVRELILTGLLPTYRMGDQLRIKQQDIDAYLQRQQGGSKDL